MEVKGWLVQFLPATSDLEIEAVQEAIEVPYSSTSARVIRAEHLIAFKLQVGWARDLLHTQMLWQQALSCACPTNLSLIPCPLPLVPCPLSQPTVRQMLKHADGEATVFRENQVGTIGTLCQQLCDFIFGCYHLHRVKPVKLGLGLNCDDFCL